MNPGRITALAAWALAAGLAAGAVAGETSAAAPAYMDAGRPVAERIADLMPRMTLDEKITQVIGDWGSKGVPRLRIPPMYKGEASHGYAYATGATIFPVCIGMAATWDTDLMYRTARIIGEESIEGNAFVAWTPVLDVAREPRWGRVEETFGEDPFMVSRFGVAWVKGYQSLGLAATPKHFAAHGQPLGGRDSNDVEFSERSMREVHLVPFRDAVREAGALGIMAAYSTWNGVPANASRELLQKILREEWGFEGHVVTDVGAGPQFVSKHAVAENEMLACKLALDAGVDQEDGGIYQRALKKAIEAGIVFEDELDRPVAKILEMKFRLGLFEKQLSRQLWEGGKNWDAPAHRAVALEAARKSIVLVKNRDNFLPLSKELKNVAVVGFNAATARTGGYSGKIKPGQTVSVLDAMKKLLAGRTNIHYAKGCEETSITPESQAEAVAAAEKSDVVVAVLGDTGALTGENHDRAHLDLPAAQETLLKALHATGKPVVLVLVNGRPFTINWAAANLPAVLVTWFPGEEGGTATAEVLFGDVNPSGKLPVTFPLSVAQAPFFYNFKTSGRSYKYSDLPFVPLYPFGHGLSYTTFEYANLRAEPDQQTGRVKVQVDVKNTGKRTGDEVAQLYVTDEYASIATPVVELKGFQRVEGLEPGQTRTLTFELDPYRLSLLDADLKRVVEPGSFKVMVGGVSPWIEAKDRMKERMGYASAKQGANGRFVLERRFAADYVCTLEAPEAVRAGEPFTVRAKLENRGAIADVAEARLFLDGREYATRRVELDPGKSCVVEFPCTAFRAGASPVALLLNGALTARSIDVAAAPAGLRYDRTLLAVPAPDVVEARARVRNIGSEPYAGVIPLVVDGKTVASREVRLAPGEEMSLELRHRFAENGLYEVKLGELPAKTMDVPGSIALPSRHVALWMDMDALKDGRTADRARRHLDGTAKGGVEAVSGKTGGALRFAANGELSLAEPLDLRDKSFTLAAWVKLETLGKNDSAGLFGGTAPDGAGQDGTGYVMHIGIREKKPFAGFFGADLKGKKEVPVGEWFHFAYVYDADAKKGALYLDGRLDNQGNQKPYLGNLTTLGASPILPRGVFALDQAMVWNTALPAADVARLAGLIAAEAARGRYVTALQPWNVADGKPLRLVVDASVPVGTRAAVEVESTGGKAARAIVALQDGKNVYDLAGLDAGGQLRLALSLESDALGATPIVKTCRVTGERGEGLVWSTQPEWDRGAWEK